MKSLILFSYCELNKNPQLRIDNLNFFLNKGLINDPNHTFVFIINGHKLSVKIPKRDNIKVIYRYNHTFDFGAYSHYLLHNDIKSYDYFFFINDSVRGPFLFNWFPNIPWTQIYTTKINDNLKLLGSTINFFKGRVHITSSFFMTDKIGLDILIKNKIFSNKRIDKKPVRTHEIKQSQIILDNKYNIGCMLEVYKNVDFRIYRGKQYGKDGNLNANFKGSCDPLYKRKFFGININPFETIFYKTNRSIDPILLKKYTKWFIHGNKYSIN